VLAGALEGKGVHFMSMVLDPARETIEKTLDRLGQVRPMQMVEQADKWHFRSMEAAPAQAWYWAAVGSLVASAALFFSGKRSWGLFVGEWVPTLLILPVLYKMVRPSRERMGEGMRQAAREAMTGAEEMTSRGRSDGKRR
jgi:hypothetical protein